MELKKILLVDDSQPFNFLTRLVLTQNGVNCKIDEALNGKTALDYINKSAECPDIILLDINMPVMDGFEFLAEFKKLSKCANTRIYILTSSNREEDRNQAIEDANVKGYFDKPFSREHLNEILKSLTASNN